jgi:hypothetical protein
MAEVIMFKNTRISSLPQIETIVDSIVQQHPREKISAGKIVKAIIIYSSLTEW